LGGYDPLPEMAGQSISSRAPQRPGSDTGISATDQEIIRQRLSGLGYI
jgi:hypothetical protein